MLATQQKSTVFSHTCYREAINCYHQPESIILNFPNVLCLTFFSFLWTQSGGLCCYFFFLNSRMSVGGGRGACVWVSILHYKIMYVTTLAPRKWTKVTVGIMMLFRGSTLLREIFLVNLNANVLIASQLKSCPVGSSCFMWDPSTHRTSTP